MTGNERVENSAPREEDLNEESKLERERFISKTPFLTLLTISIGPLMLAIGTVFIESLDLFMITKAYGESAIVIIGAGTLIRLVAGSLTTALGPGTIATCAKLLAQNRREQAERLLVDVIRIAFLSTAILCLILSFLSRPFLTFLGCPDDRLDKAEGYLRATFILLPFCGLFQISSAALQSQGKSIVNGICQVISLVSNGGIFAPILFFAIKVPFEYASLSPLLSRGVPALIIWILIFNGKLGMKPKLQYFISKFTPESKNVILNGLPSLINSAGEKIPSLLFFSYTIKAAKNEKIDDPIGKLMTVNQKILAVTTQIPIAFSQGFLTCGSYSFGGKHYSRLILLFLYTCTIVLVYQIFWTLMMGLNGRGVSTIWLSHPDALNYASSYLRIPYYTCMLTALSDICVQCLLSTGKTIFSIIAPLFELLVSIGFVYLFYYTDDHNSLRMMYVYNCVDLCTFALCAGFTIPVLLKIWNIQKNNESALT